MITRDMSTSINYKFPLLDDIISDNLGLEQVVSPKNNLLYRRTQFTIVHNNNDIIKDFIINTINECLRDENFQDVYNAKYEAEVANQSYPMICDRRRILGNCIMKRNPFNWQVCTFHETSSQEFDNVSDYHKFEINIYQLKQMEFDIEFQSMTNGTTAFHDLYRRTKELIEGGIIEKRMAFLKLYSTYNDETTSIEEAVFENNIVKYAFNPDIGKEIVSYMKLI